MSTLYLVLQEIAPENEGAWRDWMLDEHIPEVLREPGFVSARLYRVDGLAADGWQRHAAVYELESREALDTYLGGPAVLRLRAAFEARWQGRARATRLVLDPETGVVGRAPDAGP